MYVRFDALNRAEMPNMYVCSPGSYISQDGTIHGVSGCLYHTSDEEIIFNFNSMSELNLRAYMVNTGNKEEDKDAHDLYKSLQNRRMIYVEGIGYFIITGVTDGMSNENGHYKDIHADSCELEIQNINMPYVKDGTYKFSDIMATLISGVPMWVVGDVPPEISNKYRTFNDVAVDRNILSFMIEDMQNAYECIFIFDIKNRIINVYDKNNYSNLTEIQISEDDVINSVEISENSDNLYTAMSVFGDEDLNISPLNPIGGNVIYDFSYYLSWMPASLSDKVRRWQRETFEAEREYKDLNTQLYKLITDESISKSELDKLRYQADMYKRCRDNIVAENSTSSVKSFNESIKGSGGTEISIDKDVGETMNEIDNLIAIANSKYNAEYVKFTSIVERKSDVSNKIYAIVDRLGIKKYFSKEEYDELYHYIYEGEYRDEYISVTDIMTPEDRFSQMSVLYDRAKSQLANASAPSQEFSVDVDNFLFIKDFSIYANQLSTGCIINVAFDNDIAQLFLSSFTLNWYDKTLSMTFGNRINKFDQRAIFNDVLGSVKKSSNTLDYVKDIITPIKNGELDKFKEALEISRTLTKNSVMSSENQQVFIDDTGYTGKKKLDDGTFDPRQVKINNNAIVFTDDAWDTSKTALGEIILGDGKTTYGISAESIIGNLLMGKNLRILDSHGNDLFTVIDGKISASVSDYDARITKIEQDSSSLSIKINSLENKDITSVRTITGYTFDENGLIIYKDGQEIKNKLDNTGMYVTRNSDAILTANNKGVEAINLKSNQYLIVGENSRFEDYSDDSATPRTGCFYVGA